MICKSINQLAKAPTVQWYVSPSRAAGVTRWSGGGLGVSKQADSIVGPTCAHGA